MSLIQSLETAEATTVEATGAAEASGGASMASPRVTRRNSRPASAEKASVEKEAPAPKVGLLAKAKAASEARRAQTKTAGREAAVANARQKYSCRETRTPVEQGRVAGMR